MAVYRNEKSPYSLPITPKILVFSWCFATNTDELEWVLPLYFPLFYLFFSKAFVIHSPFLFCSYFENVNFIVCNSIIFQGMLPKKMRGNVYWFSSLRKPNEDLNSSKWNARGMVILDLLPVTWATHLSHTKKKKKHNALKFTLSFYDNIIWYLCHQGTIYLCSHFFKSFGRGDRS